MFERQRNRESKRDLPYSGLLPQIPNTLHWARLNSVARNSILVSISARGTKCCSRCVWLLGVCVSKKLQFQVQPGLEPRQADRECRQSCILAAAPDARPTQNYLQDGIPLGLPRCIKQCFSIRTPSWKLNLRVCQCVQPTLQERA